MKVQGRRFSAEAESEKPKRQLMREKVMRVVRKPHKTQNKARLLATP